MARLRRWVLGPELFWVVLYLLCHVAARFNTPPGEAGNQLLERVIWGLPLLGVPLSFVVFYWVVPAPAGRGWLTARLVFATFVGLNACLIRLIEAIDYGDSRNSGVLGFWVGGLILGGAVWFACYIAVVILGWLRSRPARTLF